MNMKVFFIAFTVIFIVGFCRERMASASSLDEASQETVIVDGEKKEPEHEDKMEKKEDAKKEKKEVLEEPGVQEAAEPEAAAPSEVQEETADGEVFNTDELGSLGICILFVLCLILGYCISKVFFHK